MTGHKGGGGVRGGGQGSARWVGGGGDSSVDRAPDCKARHNTDTALIPQHGKDLSQHTESTFGAGSLMPCFSDAVLWWARMKLKLTSGIRCMCSRYLP